MATKERMSLRVESARLEKLRNYADGRRKTMTAIVEDWIDTLPEPESRVPPQHNMRKTA